MAGFCIFAISAVAESAPDETLFDPPLSIKIAGQEKTVTTCNDLTALRHNAWDITDITSELNNYEWVAVTESLTECSLHSQLHNIGARKVSGKNITLEEVIKNLPVTVIPDPAPDAAEENKGKSIPEVYSDLVIKNGVATSAKEHMRFVVHGRGTYITTSGRKFRIASIASHVTDGTWGYAQLFIIYNNAADSLSALPVDYNTKISNSIFNQ